MKLENRYIIIKQTDLENVSRAGLLKDSEIKNIKSLLDSIFNIRLIEGKQPLECLVIESDWPEYEPVRSALIARINGNKSIRQLHAEWSNETFGNVGPIGPLKHLSKEALEAAAAPEDLSEWADMQFLFWDAMRRAGITDEQLNQAMKEKLVVNKARKWPEPKDGEPRLHIKIEGA